MPNSHPEKPRVIRVFVSSTFSDMHWEREELVKQVFPRLRKLCYERSVTFSEVDLRWGITEEEAHNGEVLPICLAEIERCRPYFVGILGQRYGWVPKGVDAHLLEREPWLDQQPGRSVTELEILHGVLTAPTHASTAAASDSTTPSRFPGKPTRHDSIRVSSIAVAVLTLAATSDAPKAKPATRRPVLVCSQPGAVSLLNALSCAPVWFWRDFPLARRRRVQKKG